MGGKYNLDVYLSVAPTELLFLFELIATGMSSQWDYKGFVPMGTTPILLCSRFYGAFVLLYIDCYRDVIPMGLQRFRPNGTLSTAP